MNRRSTAIIVGALTLLALACMFVMPVIGLLVAVQSGFLNSALARIPVGLALLAFNTHPLWTRFCS